MRVAGEVTGHTVRLRPWSVEAGRTLAGLPDAEPILSWLQEEGSITARLRQRWPTLQVEVKQEGVFAAGAIEATEAIEAGLPPHTDCWLRVVRLHADGAALVSAQTVLPNWAAAHPWRAVASLGTRPLADLLFGQTGLQRPGREFSLFLRNGQVLPARRCVYIRNGAALWLTEAFDLLAQPIEALGA